MRWLSATYQDSLQLACDQLVNGGVIAWWQGRSEMGPRALGARSILADPRDYEMKDHLNTKVKHREEWRPYAPVVMECEAAKWLDLPSPIPPVMRLMMLSADVLQEKEDEVPAITHVDGSTRPQMVNEGRILDLLTMFYAATGIPMLLNTSFNDSGEPIVETPKDALQSFRRMELDGLMIGDYYVIKEDEQ